MKANGIEEDQEVFTTVEHLDDLYTGLVENMKKHPEHWS